jgi:hypothetical protein
MKQCPQCNEHFGDEQNFCDSDGTPLIDETALLRAALQNSASGPLVMPVQSQASKVWPIVTIGILVGVIISLGAYVVIMTATSEKENAKSSRPESARLSSTDRSAQVATIKPGPLPTVEEPVVEPSPEETASPTPAEVAEAPKEPSVSLNQGPISTNREDGEKRGRKLIKLKSGVLVEADAAWEDQLGIWYRQGGLVSYVERERIESIGEPARSKPAAAETEKP